jgi:hypothetical protein
MQLHTNLAPIILFTYNRLTELQQTVNALKRNFLAPHSELYIFSDAPKKEHDIENVSKVRNYIHTIKGFKNITIYESPKNLGLANSVITGVTKIVSIHKKAIVLEDDLISSPNFLSFMNEALEFYKDCPKVFSISGYSFPLRLPENDPFDVYFGYRASSWGWGVWERTWKNIDWEMNSLKRSSLNTTLRKKISRGGNDMPRMLKKQMAHKIDSWAIRWCFHQTLRDQYTVFPKTSKISHIGEGGKATHVSQLSNSIFDTHLDRSRKTKFKFPEKAKINNSIAQKFKYKFSYRNKAFTYMKALLKTKIINEK